MANVTRSTGITINADDPRTIRALEIAAEADQWLRWHTDDGQDAFGVPSQSLADQYYVVTRSTCDCPDFRRHTLEPAPLGEAGARAAGEADEQRACKHILAVRLYTELLRAQARLPQHHLPRRRPRPSPPSEPLPF